ncbi:subclass B3 metallo-beta-lactamase [Granulicella mallensis]|uniref:Beta-lactamase domain protein n=1 Tax=Granulicella mallensis (strain ATCC BAA-1857 / DSM 23137 / MP5ACTX8) TaxID=682795 RepID=G8NPC1_GRAMM|nr:subclass B3 metallo-beta-lactamase [Granulicella mallensis]AEU34841.1 beta-lactamase domain protein [Granulicella mallensis MP5ACTX8]
MSPCRKLLCLVVILFSFGGLHAQMNPDWTTPVSPFRIADNLYYVGSRDLASYLVTTPAGNILINANLPSSPPQIRASVEQLGFRWKDTKILLNGQAHFDHMGGSAQILRETHAKNMVMEGDADVVRSGGRTDFAAGTPGILQYAPARVDRVLHDGDTLSLGGVILTAHKTGGHTRGCTTWAFRVHIPSDPPGKLRDVVIIGGFTVLSQYRLTAIAPQPGYYPGIAQDYAHTFATLRALPCDLFLADHGSHFGLLEKLARLPKEGATVWLDPEGYKRAVAEHQKDFEDELEKQRRGGL